MNSFEYVYKDWSFIHKFGVNGELSASVRHSLTEYNKLEVLRINRKVFPMDFFPVNDMIKTVTRHCVE